MKIGEVGKRLNVSVDVVRYAANTYSAFLSDSAGGKLKGITRSFTDRDCQVVATIIRGRELGLSPEQIEATLKAETFEDCPEAPRMAEIEARAEIALIAKPEYERALDQVKIIQNQLQLARQERDSAMQTWQADTTKLNDRIAALERELGIAQGTLKERLPMRVFLGILGIAVVLAVVVTAALLLLAGRGG